MKAHLHTFIDALRQSGVPISIGETLDALHAVSVVGLERATFREALAAALVKDHSDRPAFDLLFDRFFALPAGFQGKRKLNHTHEQGEGHRTGSVSSGSPARVSGRPPERKESARAEATPKRADSERSEAKTRLRLAQKRALLNRPFEDMEQPDVESCEVLLSELAHHFHAYVRRRQRRSSRGRLDVRRTIRRSISTGGVPIDPAFRKQRPGHPALVVLCDFSHSVVIASRFLVSLLVPAEAFFRRVRLFGYVDRAIEVSVDHGTLVPHGNLDLYARSDFGKVLVRFWDQHQALITRNTLVLILGDARNNRRPPRTDVLGAIHRTARQVVWLNPETPDRWNTGDSVIRVYEAHCDTVLAASNLTQLYGALKRVFRSM